MAMKQNLPVGLTTFRFWMTDRVHTRLRFLAKQQNSSMSSLINELIEEGLDRRNETQAVKSTSALLELAQRSEDAKWAMPTDVRETRSTVYADAWQTQQGKKGNTGRKEV